MRSRGMLTRMCTLHMATVQNLSTFSMVSFILRQKCFFHDILLDISTATADSFEHFFAGSVIWIVLLDYCFFFAYSLGQKSVSQQIKVLGSRIAKLVGKGGCHGQVSQHRGNNVCCKNSLVIDFIQIPAQIHVHVCPSPRPSLRL